MSGQRDALTSDNSPFSLPKQLLGAEQVSLVQPSALQLNADLPQYTEEVGAYLRASISANTRRAYLSDLREFSAWGGVVPTTPSQLANYLAEQAPRLSPFTLGRRLVAIGHAHTSRGFANPCDDALVRATLRGIRRIRGCAQRRVEPVLRDDLFVILDAIPETTRGCRDRALLLVGFAGGFRRSELVGLTMTDVKTVPEGLLLEIARSKTDQEGHGRTVAIPYGRSRACPVSALLAWTNRATPSAGPLFPTVKKGGVVTSAALSPQSVALIVKHYVQRAGLDPAKFSGHSLRAGLATSAAKAGVSIWKIRAQTGHRSEAVLARYVRDADLFSDNAAGALL